MAISEHDRYELHKWLIDNAGEHVAETMMAHLPPAGWADVATKRDLDLLAATMRGGMHELRGEMHLMRAEFHEALRIHLMVIVGLYVCTLGAVVAFLR